MKTLYMVDITEHEYEAGWGSSCRPNGKAFCEDKNIIIRYFNILREAHSREYYLSINEPRLVRVSENCGNFFFYKTNCKNGDKVLRLQGESLKEFMKGVEH